MRLRILWGVVRWEQMFSGRGMTCKVRTAETDIDGTFGGRVNGVS